MAARAAAFDTPVYASFLHMLEMHFRPSARGCLDAPAGMIVSFRAPAPRRLGQNWLSGAMEAEHGLFRQNYFSFVSFVFYDTNVILVSSCLPQAVTKQMHDSLYLKVSVKI